MGWVLNVTLPPLYPLETYPFPIVQEARWAPGPPGEVWKFSPPPEFDLGTVQLVASRYTD